MVTKITALSLMVLGATIASAVPKQIPALVEPATNVQIPGKLVWSDIFSTEPNSSARFYGALFDWTSRTFTDDNGKYIILGSEKGPVMGVVRGPDRKDKRPSARWLSYFSSDNVSAAVDMITANKGRVLAGPLAVPDRGLHVIAADPEGALFGLMDSTNGDPVDREIAVGEIYWSNLFSHEPAQVVGFYEQVTGTKSSPWLDEGFLLATGDSPRAGISDLIEDTSVTPTWVPFIRVADIDRKLKTARRLGAKLVVEKRVLENGTQLAILADPLGAVFGVVQPSDQPEGNL